MKQFLFAFLFASSLLSSYSVRAYEYFERKKYHVALHATNPLSLGSKGGGLLEYRMGKWSELVGYTKYWNAYAGTQYNVQFQRYFRSRKPHEYFIYFKSVVGDATYSSKKLALFGDPTDILLGPVTYTGGGLGVGRRYNYNFFFFTWNLGVKYCTLTTDLTTDQQRMFRLFYFTGPGSLLEFNLHFGIQL